MSAPCRKKTRYFEGLQREMANAVGQGQASADEAAKEIDREYDRRRSLAKEAANRPGWEYRERAPRLPSGPVERREER